MPAATPKPTLEDLLIILSRSSGLRANFLSVTDPNTVELCFTFKREHLGPAAEFVFSYPSSIFPAIKDLLEYDDVLEKAFRANDPRNTPEDCFVYIQQKREYTRVLNGLSDKMDAAFFDSTLKYLGELIRRRCEADRRAKEAAEARARRDAEEIKRKVEEEIRKREEERRRAKEEAHRRWEEEERQRRSWQEKKEDVSGGNARGQQYYSFDEMLRSAGMDPNDSRFKDAYNRANRRWYEHGSFDFGAGQGRYENPFGRGWTDPPPPPTSGGKRKWYEILGCAPGAKPDEIRAAARRAAKGLHPDNSTDPQAKEKFQEISQAKAEGLAGCV
jgi:DnaJ-domain-containing protein 1